MFVWLVYEKQSGVPKELSMELKAGFSNRKDATQYADMMNEANKLAGIKDVFIVKENVHKAT